MSARQTQHVADWISELGTLRTQFGGPAAERKAELLCLVSQNVPSDPKALIDLHELLLFIVAYPDNEAVLSATGTEGHVRNTRVVGVGGAMSSTGAARWDGVSVLRSK